MAAPRRSRSPRLRHVARGLARRRTASGDGMLVPRGVRVAGAWSWRLLVIGAAVAVFIFIVVQLRLIVVPVMVAILLTALLTPAVDWLQRHRWPRVVAVAVTFLLALIVVGALVALAVWQVRLGAPDLRHRSVQVFDELRTWLRNGPLGLSNHEIVAFRNRIGAALGSDSQFVINGALSVGSKVGHVAVGFVLAIFSTLFILFDGRAIWGWTVRLFPRRARAAVDGAGRSGWLTLVSFVRVQILVASIDTVGIGLGVLLLGLPLVVPIAVLVFLGSFVPVVGAVVTGAIAVFIALVYNGWVVALLMLAVVLLVQEVESHVLQPLIMGTAVKVHPLAVVLAVAAGTLLAGIPGALFAVPMAAVANVMIRYVASGTWRGGPIDEADGSVWRVVPVVRRRRGLPRA
ncbi:MAG TPA: AI-2E family transporter [Microbacteriaceae bacterium]|nr:AI-2E family transporter [Microbacteriaceae bacterium]